MKKLFFIVLIFSTILALIILAVKLRKELSSRNAPFGALYLQGVLPNKAISVLASDALQLLKIRQDSAALAAFEQILATHPDNLDVLWGKAEVLRRNNDYEGSEKLLSKILKLNPQHAPSLVSLCYIRYKNNKLDQAVDLANQVLKIASDDTESRALAYMMLGSINSRRSQEGSFLSKIAYGVRIKRYFLKAKELAPGLAEVHLGLGTFYLLAPSIIGGDLDKSIIELELCAKIAPEFAAAYARLAQAYKKNGSIDKYNLYIERARKLDPQSEMLKEIEK